MKVVHRRLDVKACFHCAFILKQVPAFDRPLKVTIPGEEKKDARGFKVVPTVDEDSTSVAVVESDEEGQDRDVGEKPGTYNSNEGDGESDGGVDNLGDGESTAMDGDSTVVTGISMVTDRCRLEGTISGLSSGNTTTPVRFQHMSEARTLKVLSYLTGLLPPPVLSHPPQPFTRTSTNIPKYSTHLYIHVHTHTRPYPTSEWLTLDEWHEEKEAAVYICTWIYHHRRRHRMQVMIAQLHENRRVAICKLQVTWGPLKTYRPH